jgi:hypothetical protein
VESDIQSVLLLKQSALYSDLTQLNLVGSEFELTTKYMSFQEIPFNGGRYNVKRRFALHVKCLQFFIIRNKTYILLENVCGVGDMNFLDNSSNRI